MARTISSSAGARGSRATAPVRTAAAGRRVLRIELRPRTLRLDPGAEATLTLDVENAGELIEGVAFAVHGAVWATMPTRRVNLDVAPYAGARQQVEISIRPPRAPSTRPGRYEIRVWAWSTSEPFTTRCVDTCVLIVNSYADASLTETSNIAKAG